MNRRPQQMELFPASQIAERLGNNDRLMEMILERNNIIRAWKQVYANKGAPGVDGMKTGQLGNYLAKHWPEIEQDLLNCKHKPLPVKRKRCINRTFLSLAECCIVGFQQMFIHVLWHQGFKFIFCHGFR